MEVLRCEKKTIEAMVCIYCRGNGHEGSRAGGCASCRDLLTYAHERLDKCVFGENKSVCAQCPIHCYQPERRAEIKAVMRYAGPRMLLRHPWLALQHRLAKKKKFTSRVQAVIDRKSRAGSGT